jgi:hypothetical protein
LAAHTVKVIDVFEKTQAKGPSPPRDHLRSSMAPLSAAERREEAGGAVGGFRSGVIVYRVCWIAVMCCFVLRCVVRKHLIYVCLCL